MLLLGAALVFSACDTGTTFVPVPVRHEDSTEIKAKYLAEYFDIAVSGPLTQDVFADNLLLLQPPSASGRINNKTPFELGANPAAETLKTLDAVKFAVIGANLKELALVYSDEKISRILSGAGINGIPAGEHRVYVAAALDAELISTTQARLAVNNISAEKDFIISLLQAVADYNNVSRRLLGYSDDPGLYAKVLDAQANFAASLASFTDPVLYGIGSEGVTANVTTGFNLKANRYNARFLTELTIIYGHSAPKHAKQIIGLLNSEGLVVKVGLEPKASRFYYGGSLHAPEAEYDLILEFSSRADLLRFDGIILQYADKPTPGNNISGAWNDPMYYAAFDPGPGYKEVIDNNLRHGEYVLHPLSLKEDGPTTLTAFQSIIETSYSSDGVTIEQIPVWANEHFWAYMGGS
ncbi:MAG: hypothetical protein LBP23_05305 [Treponema sp.]|nr:hypothetical protein [Treponema sp.]